MKRLVLLSVFGAWLLVIAGTGCGGSDIKDPPKDFRVKTPAKVSGKKGGTVTEEGPIPPLPANK